jgi:hexosaminidase
MYRWGIIIGLFVMACALFASAEDMLPLMPMPAHVERGTGSFAIDTSLKLSVTGKPDERVSRAVDRFLGNLSRRTGILLRNTPDESTANFIINCASPGEKVQALEEDESYRLQITPAAVRLDAPNPLGVLHGLQTFLQLVSAEHNGFAAPAIVIDDQPRFPWRGLLIDACRHFMPVEVIKRNLDGMEALKFNVLHWHLSEDQGFRVESKKFPRFQQVASDGLFYTQDQIREVIAYARDRGIRVVPEFDMPGHTTSWFVAYPELASAPGPYEIERKWGIFDPAMDPTKDHTYEFLNNFIAEMARLFPDLYFHIGGDEVNGKQWRNNPRIRAFMRKHHIKDNHALQAYFNQRLQKIVRRHGKIMMGWDEILHPGLPKDIVVQSWRGQKSLADAARQGYRGLLSFGYYLDLMYPASRHYSVDPLGNSAADLTAEEKHRVLGGEACMWAEFVTPANVDGRIWPRAAAIGERLWSPQEITDLDSMYSRLAIVSEGLERLGLTHNAAYRLMLERLAGSGGIQSLELLADLLEPVKGRSRGKARRYDSTIPLDRLVDAVHPESDRSRQFAAMVERVVNNSATAADLDTMQKWLTLWRDDDRQLRPVFESNSSLKEIAPISEELATVAGAGLQALDYLKQGGHAPASWRDQQLLVLKQYEQPQAELLNMVVPSIGKLIAATKPE